MADKLEPTRKIERAGTVGEFWQWAYSDILSNTNRGVFAEYLVGKALGDDVLANPRVEWDCTDLEYGEYHIEVKSSAYVQSWHKLGDKSTIRFGIGKKKCWDADTDKYRTTPGRYSDCYVFCLFPRERKDNTRDVLDVEKWGFYVIATEKLECKLGDDQDRKSVGITWVKDNCGAQVGFHGLKKQIDDVLRDVGPKGSPGS